MPRSRLTAGAGLIVMVLGIAQVIMYGFVPVTALPGGLARIGAIVLLTGVPLLAVVGLWIRQTDVLARETHIHDLLIGAVVLAVLIQAVLLVQGPITLAELGSFSFISLLYFIAGLLGLGGAFALLLGGYVLYHQPGYREDRFPHLFRVYRMTGLVTSFFVVVGGLEVISQTAQWLGFRSIWAILVPGTVWVLGAGFGHVFAIKGLTRFHTDQDVEDVYASFAPQTSPITQLWKLYGLELIEVDDHEARFRRRGGKEILMRQVEADHPSIREYRTVQDGRAASTTLLAFADCDDGADVTMETVTDRRLPLLGLPVIYARARFNDVVLEDWGFRSKDGFFDAGLGDIEHEF